MTRALVSPLLAFSIALAAATTAGAASTATTRFDADDVSSALRAVPMAGRVFVDGLPLADSEARASLELTRFRVFAPDAAIRVHGEGGTRRLAPPDNAYFQGRIAGRPDSRAVLTVRASGEVRGVVAAPGEYWIVAPAVPGQVGPPAVRRLAAADEFAARIAGFECEVGGLDGAAALEEVLAGGSAPQPSTPLAGERVTLIARVAIETDFEYYGRFTNDPDRIDYAGDLIAFSSATYGSEVDTGLQISGIELWSTAADPWTQTSSSSCQLLQFGRYWNQNHSGDSRTIAHMLSGRGSLSGVAWIGVLCSGAFSVNHQGTCPGLSPQNDSYGGGYGFTGGISGSFDIDNPGVLWDIVATTHEIGHNFNSPHTHCYAGLNGSAQQIDTCSALDCGDPNFSCFCGTGSLPCGVPGGGCGTIMSYCHLLGGNFTNVSFTFGQGHPFGVMPERVPTRMNAHAVSRAAANPSCFIDAILFDDGFESGNTGAWTDSVP